MFEGVRIQRKGEENMRDDELGVLLGKIPQPASSFNLPSLHSDSHRQSILYDHGCAYDYGHPIGYGERHVNGMYDGELFERRFASSASSDFSGFSLRPGGSSSSLYPRGLYETGSPSPRWNLEGAKPHMMSGNGFWSDCINGDDNKSFGDFNLSRDFSRMYISEGESAAEFPNDVQSRVQSPKYEVSGDYRKGSLGRGRFSLSGSRGHTRIEGETRFPMLEMQHDQRIANLLRSPYSPSPFDGMYPQSDFGTSVFGDRIYPDTALKRPSVDDTLLCASQNGMNLVEGRDAFYSSNVVQSKHNMPSYNEENLLHYQPSVPSGRNKVPLHVRVPEGCIDAFTSEDSLILQGEVANFGMDIGYARGGNMKDLLYYERAAEKPKERRSQLKGRLQAAAVHDCCQSPRMVSPFSSPSKCGFLAEAQGYIYDIAKDQLGCRFLQRIFEEGTSQDVQIIFSEIINHVVELMMNPFGNYLMQKLLEVCNEEQKMHILLRVTEEPGDIIMISLNTHGTRVVQKLIETLNSRQQISLVISALEPGIVTLIKDINGNHVVQRCLHCFTEGDSEFIFVAATKYCVDIAMHQHGCCVLQRCISLSTGELQENLIAAISANGLMLAQDAFGNYVVQFILELKNLYATSKLTRLFEGNYVNLSRQKFSSHVVEKCLVVCNNEARSKIIHELLSATYFEQLLQDPHANYVVQTALRVSEGPLHDALVNEIESYKTISGSSPYSKRIFSHKLLKR